MMKVMGGNSSWMMASLMSGSSRATLFQQCVPLRQFAYSSRYIGPNDMIRQLRDEKQKFGMKHHFYDKEVHPKMRDPHEQ